MHYIYRLLTGLLFVFGLCPLGLAQHQGRDTLYEAWTAQQRDLIDLEVDDWLRDKKGLTRELRSVHLLDTLKEQRVSDWLPELPIDSSSTELTGLRVTLSKGLSRRKGDYPGEEPGNFTRIRLQGKGALLGLPVTSRGFISNEQSPWRPPMNGVSLGLDVPGLHKEVTQALNQKIHELEKLIDPTSLEKLGDLDELLGPAGDWTQEQEMIDELTGYILHPEAWRKELDEALAQHHQTVRGQLDSEMVENGDIFSDSIAGLRSRLRDLQRGVADAQDSLTIISEETKNLRRSWRHRLMEEESSRLEVLELVRYRDSIQQHDPEKWLAYQQTKTLKEVRRMDTSDQRRALRDQGLIKRRQALMQSITAFELGMSHPSYSELTMARQAINGLHLEIEPSGAFFAATVGRGANLNLAENLNQRRFFGLGAGWGDRRKSHLRLTSIRSADVERNFQPDTVFAGIYDTIVYSSPRTNGVLSLAGQWSVSEALQFTAEMAQSSTVAQVEDSSFVENTFHIGNKVLGRAWQAGVSFENPNGTIYRGHWERIERGYQSFGSPFSRNDLEGFELRVQQSLLDHRITVAPWMSKYRDRLGGEGEESTTMVTYGASGVWKGEHGSNAQLTFLQSELSGRLDQIVTQWNATLTHPYKMGVFTMISSLAWTRTQQLRKLEVAVEESLNQQLQVSQLLSFSNGWQWRTNFQRLVGTSLHPRSQRQQLLRPQFQSLATEYANEVWNILNSRLQMRWWGTWSTAVGATIGTGNGEGFQWGWQLDSKVPIWQHFQLGVQIRFRDVESPMHNYRLFDGVFSAQFQF